MKFPRLLFLIVFACTILCGCGRQQGGRITNRDGNYSIEILPGWIHEMNGVVTRASRFETIDGEEVSATLMVTEVSAMFDDLDKNFESQTSALYELDNYKKIGEGRTQIDGVPSRWIRLNDSENNIQYTTLQYVIQRQGNKCLILNCSSTKKSFATFEEELNKMVFSFTYSK